MVLYLHSAPSCLSQLSLNQTAVTEATLVVLPSCAPQLRLLSIKQTKVRSTFRFPPYGGPHDVALSGQRRGGSGRTVRPPDSQPGRDGGVGERPGAPRLPPASVFSQFSRNLCSGRKPSPADHLRCATSVPSGPSPLLRFVKLKKRALLPLRSELDTADPPRTPLRH